jgi:hypothetical protein
MQLSPAVEVAETIIAKLETGGCRDFSIWVNRYGKLKDLLNARKIKFILAPLDAGLQAFLTATNKEGYLLATTKIGQDILENHFASIYNNRDPNLVAINNMLIPVDQKSLLRYQIIRFEQIEGVVIAFGHIVFITEDQMKEWTRERSAGFKTALGGAGLQALIMQGSIKGDDLLSLCTTNFEMEDFCNKKDALNGRTIFHDLIEREFGVKLTAGENARQEYSMRHQGVIPGYVYYRTPDGPLTIGRARITKLSDTKYIQCVGETNIIMCLTIDGVIHCYSLEQGGKLRLTLANYRSSSGKIPKIKKITKGLGIIYALGYDKIMYMYSYFTREGKVFTPVNVAGGLVVDISGGAGIKFLPGNQMGLVVDGKLQQHSAWPQNPTLLDMDSKSLIVKSSISCTLYSINKQEGTSAKFMSIDLSSFPGGPFKCTYRNVYVRFSRDAGGKLYIRNDAGELWMARRPMQGADWIKIEIPGGAPIIDMLAFIHEYNIIEHHIFTVLDSRGRIWNVVANSVELLDTIPGLVELFRFRITDVPRGIVALDNVFRLNY